MFELTLFQSPETSWTSLVKRWAFHKPVITALTSVAFIFTNTAVAQTSGRIDFGANQVPAVKNQLSVIHLSPQGAPTNFLHETLGKLGAQTSNIGPLAKSSLFADRARNIPASTIGLVENGQLRALWDQNSGDAEIFPSLANKSAMAGEAGLATLKQKALSVAQQVFARTDVIPHDATQFTVGEARPVMGADATRNDAGAVSESAGSVYLTYVSLQRKVDGIPVYGPGSNASLAIGNDGSVQGFVKRWSAGTVGGAVKETRTTDEVKSQIQALLAPLATSADVTVRSIEVAYYDDQGGTIQPAYRITAQVHYLPQAVTGVTPAEKSTDDEFVVKYLPIGSGTLAINESTAEPSNAEKPNGPVTVPDDDPTVGRYVVRNDDAAWVASANGFWNNITASPNGGLFTNLQYFWAYPYEFTTSELSFVNSVQVALTEVHGDWWYFTTYQNWGDGVDITKIAAANGYGPALGGKLNYWILHSCEVIPSKIDAPCSKDSRPWWTPWFNVFQGMHTAVGYRTIMYINDGATSPFAKNLELGAPVISAWFNATNGAPDYAGKPTAAAHCGTALPMGRPSAVTVCGHSGDTIFNQTALPAASCLTNYYQPN